MRKDNAPWQGSAVCGAALLVCLLAAPACDDSEKRMVERLNQAVLALNNDNYANARHHLEQAWDMGEVAQRDADVNYYLGFLALREDDAKKAEKHLEISAIADPARPDVHLHLARAREAMGKYKEALLALDALFALDPGHPNGHLLAARIARRAGDRQSQDKALREAIKGDPGFSVAYLMLSRLYAEVGAYKASLDVLNEGLRFAPDDLSLQEELGLAWLSLGRPDRAKDVFKVAVRHARADYSLHFNYAAALLQLGDKPLAIQQLRRYIILGKGRARTEEIQAAAKMLVKLRDL